NGLLEVELFTHAVSGTAGPLQYRVSMDGKTIVAASGLGVRLRGGAQLGRNSVIEDSQTTAIDSSFEQFPGKRKHVIDRANEATLTLRESGAKPLQWQVIVRAYDDGVALRYRFPKQAGWTNLELGGELTEFAFPPDAVA